MTGGEGQGRPLAAADVAARFVEARRDGAGFADYPGPVPRTLADAYAVQQAATTMWADGIAGWKVGRIAAPLSDRLACDRFIGPIFARTVTQAGGTAAFPAFVGGFAAFEAEFVILAAADAPAGKTIWTADEAGAIAGAMHVAVEVAGSPLASINDLGPLATIAGFGNNNGLILGPEVPGWRDLPPERLACAAHVDGTLIRQATAAAIPGGPLAAFAVALGAAAAIGMPLRTGALISTGAVTGIIPVAVGQHCLADFGVLGTIATIVVPVKG